MLKNLKIITLLFIVLIVSSCSEYQKLLKSSDFNLKYEKAKEYYQEKDYMRAVSLFEELITVFKGTKKGEEVYYYNAYCYYGMLDYIMAGYHFRGYAKTYPNGKHTEEAKFLTAYCYYMNSPESSLDQMYTDRAIEELQLFIEKYPNSDKLPECNKLIDNLRSKLELKAYDNANIYLQIGSYKAAITAFKNCVIDFPDTKFHEKILYNIVEANYLLAKNSIEKKKKERYQNTINEYYVFIDEYPSSKYIKNAEKFFDKATESKNKIK